MVMLINMIRMMTIGVGNNMAMANFDSRDPGVKKSP